MELKQKTDYFIVPTNDRKTLPPTFQVLLPVTDTWEREYILGKLSTSQASDVEYARDYLLVYHQTFTHIEAKDSSIFRVIAGDGEGNPLYQYLGRARFTNNSIIIPGNTFTFEGSK